MKLSEICEVYSGYALKSFNDIEDGLPVVKIGNILTDGTLNLEECQYTTDSVNQKYYSKKGDIYIALSGATTGKIGIMDAGKRYVINQRVGIVRQKSYDIPQEYIKYFLLRQTDRILQEAAGCAQPNISPKQIAEYVISETSKEKMQKICGVLNGIKKIIDSRKAEISELDNLIKARFVEMFGTLHDNENGFEVVTIEDVCSLIKDGTHQTPQYTENKEEGFKFLSSKDVMSQKIDWTDIKYISAELHEKLYATIKPQRNDILMSKNGVNYGVAAVNDTDEIFDIYVSLALLRPKEEIDPVFLRCVINNPETKRQFDSSIKGIGVPNLHLGEIRKTKIFLPPIELQKEFVSFAEQVYKSKVAVQKALDKTKLLFDSLMQQYFG